MGILFASEEHFNKEVAADQINVENYFERLITLWSVMTHEQKWKKKQYDNILRFCIALTNFHILHQPLRKTNADFYQQYKNRLFEIGVRDNDRKRQVQQRYKKRRRRTLNVQF